MQQDNLRNLRKQMAEKYKNCDPEEKPKTQLCNDCQQDIYNSQICHISGLLHKKEKIQIGGNAFEKGETKFTSAQLISAFNASRIKWQEARTKKVSLDTKSFCKFQSSITKNKSKYGVLYGTYDDTKKNVLVHNIFEPKQINNKNEEIHQNKNVMSFGLHRVGIILYHSPRDKDDFIISNKEIMLSAREQSIYGDHCVLITVSHDIKTQDVEVCSWQVSEQCVNLFRMSFFAKINFKKDDKCLITSYPLEISQSCSIQKSTEVDTHWFFAPVAIEQFNSNIA
jgi:hypothetical protein